MTPPQSAVSSQPEVLIVDDNPCDAELMIRALRTGGLAETILHLADGVRALDYVFAPARDPAAASQKPLKLIFLDLKLPMIGGLEVLRQLKADPQTRCIPIVVMTSSQEPKDIMASNNLGANSYIVKPLEYQTFMKKVAEVGHYWVNLNHPPS